MTLYWLVSAVDTINIKQTKTDRLRMIRVAREMPGYIYREGIHMVAAYHTA